MPFKQRATSSHLVNKAPTTYIHISCFSTKPQSFVDTIETLHTALTLITTCTMPLLPTKTAAPAKAPAKAPAPTNKVQAGRPAPAPSNALPVRQAAPPPAKAAPPPAGGMKRPPRPSKRGVRKLVAPPPKPERGQRLAKFPIGLFANAKR